MKSKFKKGKDSNSNPDEDSEEEYKRKRATMAGPKARVNASDMQAVMVHQEDDDEAKAREKLEATRQEFMGGEDDDLKQLGFLDSDDEVDFSNFKIGKRDSDSEEEVIQSKSLFSSLMSTFQNYTGNKVLNSQDIDPVLEQFTNNLTDKNVSIEIANEICKQVKKSLLNTKTASFTTIKATIQEALVDSIKTLMTPKKNIDILKEAVSAKKKGQVYSIVFIGVNGVGKSTSLAKTAYYLKTKGNLKVMIAGCDNFRSGAIEQLQTHCNCLDLPLYQKGYKDDPAIIAREAMQECKSK